MYLTTESKRKENVDLASGIIIQGRKMDRLKGKVAIVTGSTSGIGVGIAKLYAAEGAKVVICGRRAEKGQAVVDEIAAAGGEAYYHFMDMTQMDSIDKLFADTEEKYGKIDILVNNAANVGLKIWDIADTYYKNPWRYKYIARFNNIKDPDYIISGTYITIPAE